MMRSKSLFSLPLFFMIGSIAFGQQDLSNSLSFRHAVFHQPDEGPYVETYLSIFGKGLRYKELGIRQFQGEVAVTWILRRGEEVLDFQKYRLESPVVIDTNRIDFSLMDQKRLALSEGKATLELTVEDLNDPTNILEFSEEVSADFSLLPTFSDVQFVESFKKSREPGAFTKNGLDIVPYAINYYPAKAEKMTFYLELYGSDVGFDEESFLVTASIRDRESDEVNPKFWQHRKVDEASVLPLMMEFSLAELPTGNYNLIVEMRDRSNEVVTEKRTFFQRLNKQAVTSIESIAMLDVEQTWVERYDSEQMTAFLSYLKPTASQSENNIITSLEGNGDLAMQKRFLYNYWLSRDDSNPYERWLDYLKLVKQSNDMFETTSRQGYRTDRGRIMLTHGKPSDVVTSVQEPSAKPYEIWQYNVLEDGQTNVRFVFYEPSVVSNDYRLIHSNAVGELSDPGWKTRVYQGLSSDQPSIDPLGDSRSTVPFGARGGSFEDDLGGGGDRP